MLQSNKGRRAVNDHKGGNFGEIRLEASLAFKAASKLRRAQEFDDARRDAAGDENPAAGGKSQGGVPCDLTKHRTE